MKVGRNKLCPCGSGKKYKYCCLKKDNYLKNLPDNALKRLKEDFSKYNQKDLIKTLAALSTCSENQSQQIRLEIATQIACSNINCGNKIITIHELNELFLKYLPSEGPIGLLEDPSDNLFTHNISFFKNNVIFTGPSTSEYYVLQKILNCIHFNSSVFSEEYLNYFYQNSMFILFLSDYIAKKSGHDRYEVYEDRFRQEIFFPNIHELDTLKESVTLNINELKEFKGLNIDENVGEDFIIEVGNDNFNNILLVEKKFKEANIFKDTFSKSMYYSESVDNNPLLSSPLIKIENTYILFPPLLPISLRYNILSSIVKFNEKNNFIKNYQKDLWSNILFNLKNKLHFEYFDYKLPEWTNTKFKDEIFKIDNDKLAYCILVNDNLKNYGKNGPCEKIDLKYKSKLKNRIDLIINNFDSDESINDILIILFIGQSGRQYYTEIPNNVLMINCEEFEILVNSGKYDSLTLFKFAKLLENRNIQGFSFLDKFSFYIEKNHSFSTANEKEDVLLLSFDVTSECTKKLRKKAIKDKDPHLESYGDKLVSVKKINEFMYVTGSNLFLIKVHDQNIWINFENYFESTIAEAICYWIWQFSDELQIDLNSLKNRPIFISINIEEYDDLDLTIEITNEIKENLIIFSNVSNKEINFRISKYLISIANQENNEADRLLMNEILKLIGILLEKNSLENTLTEERRHKIINKNAPLVLKKYIRIYASENIMNIPVKNQIRLLQEHNVQLVMDDLANKVQCEFEYNQKLTKEQSLELSHQIVDYLLDCIKKEIVKYDWDDIIQKLILNYENILFNRYYSSTNNIYSLNSYDNPSSILKDIITEGCELDKLGLATRTLIEILSAEQNFTNEIKISNESFDNLMALSHNYIDWAFISDYIKSEHVDFEMTPLESGRFEIKTNLNDILDTFRSKRTLEHINNLSPNIFHYNTSGEKPSDEEEKAFESEFGITLTDYVNFISVLISLAVDNEKDIVFISKSKLVNILKENLGWEYNKSVQAIESFSLSHRGNWNTPPEGFSENDINPWVFRRPLSYYLKPLIIKNDEDKTVIYGFRNVYHSGSNLLYLIFKGLYKTDNSSKKFKKFIGKMSDIKGKEFNEKVFKWFENNLDTSKFYLEQNVKVDKIVKVEPKYGDIDILLLDNNEKRLFSIECKDIEGARNPREIFHEIEKFFDNKKWIKKHNRRESWIKKNLDKLGKKIGHDLKDYKVFSFFIVSQELPIIYLKKTPIDILPFPQIKNEGPTFLDKYK